MVDVIVDGDSGEGRKTTEIRPSRIESAAPSSPSARLNEAEKIIFPSLCGKEDPSEKAETVAAGKSNINGKKARLFLMV